MTIRQHCEAWIYQHGVFEDTCKQIVAHAETQPQLESMKGRWDESKEGYPPFFLATLQVSLGAIAYAWIKEHQPSAWYLLCFREYGPAGELDVPIPSEGKTLEQVSEERRPYLKHILTVIAEMDDAGLLPGENFRWCGLIDGKPFTFLFTKHPEIYQATLDHEEITVTFSGQNNPLGTDQ